MKEFNLNVLDGGEEPISANAGVDEAIHVMISDKKSKEWIDQDFKFVLVIKALAVHPDFQKLGLGKELLMRMLYDIIFVQQLKFQVCSALAWYKGIGNDAHSAVIFKSVGMQEVYRRDQYWKAICNRAYSCPLKDIEDFIDCKCGAALFVGFFAAANAYVDDWRSRHLIV
jgi:GNAT superfamily N-acetyltransferase